MIAIKIIWFFILTNLKGYRMSLLDTKDIDPIETEEWLDSINSVIDRDGINRAIYLAEKIERYLSSCYNYSFFKKKNFTDYKNTISINQQYQYPGNIELEKKIEGIIRWNAAIMVVNSNKKDPSIGGHIGTFASICTLYEVGFNHFWKTEKNLNFQDIIYFQGHSSPGIYARSFLEGRLSFNQIENFRKETKGIGISSYPHPWLMPNYWQFATVSMGLGPIGSIYQARFIKYMKSRKLIKKNINVWVFIGDGEMDEPESMGAISRAGREKLDNLIFIINCNLQRLDGLVYGNGKIIQELEKRFIGSDWNVIKVIWGSNWESLFKKDKNNLLQDLLNKTCDGEFQTYRARGGSYMRKYFFGKNKEIMEMVSDMSDEDIHNLTYGGHDPVKIYSAYKKALEFKGKPTVILAKTVKGFGMGEKNEARNIAHNQKKLEEDDLKHFCNYFKIKIPEKYIKECKFYKPDEKNSEMLYMHERRKNLYGYIPYRNTENIENICIPHYTNFAKRLIIGTKNIYKMSTTMVFVQILSTLSKDKIIGKRVIPITPDESRTFGMEGLFRQLGIYNPDGQIYEPEDRKNIMWYKESKDGQILQEGINEGGAISSWIAAGTSYSVHKISMIPFYIFYSMFGFQRIMDYIWMAADMQSKGFLIGATSGRTTINGEGLQHQDGHSHIMAGLVPNCISYDPTYAYELAIILWYGMKKMYVENQPVFYYITVTNENYYHPKIPKNCEEGIIKGLYKLKSTKNSNDKDNICVQLIGSGSILCEIKEAAKLLKKDFNIFSDIWSLTSSNQIYRDGQKISRWNRLHPNEKPKKSYIYKNFENTNGPVIIATDYVKLYGEQLRAFIPNSHVVVLGTDGFGRSDTRSQLRSHFEIDRYHIIVSSLKALYDDNIISNDLIVQAIKKYNIDVDKIDPLLA